MRKKSRKGLHLLWRLIIVLDMSNTSETQEIISTIVSGARDQTFVNLVTSGESEQTAFDLAMNTDFDLDVDESDLRPETVDDWADSVNQQVD